MPLSDRRSGSARYRPCRCDAVPVRPQSRQDCADTGFGSDACTAASLHLAGVVWLHGVVAGGRKPVRVPVHDEYCRRGNGCNEDRQPADICIDCSHPGNPPAPDIIITAGLNISSGLYDPPENTNYIFNKTL